MTDQPQGRVLQVNVSGGGVPKKPVESAWVGRFGLIGDAHREYTVHGGPYKAVCLFGIEVIERLQSEGHPVEPGSVGENLTTAGVEWSLLPVGTRARIGEALEIELTQPAMPCATQTRNFRDGNFNRMRIDFHPSDSRMYGRVLSEGEVRAGDPITILPPLPDSHAVDDLLLKRLDRAEMKSSVAAWRAAKKAGFEISIVEDGDIAMAAAPEIGGPAFNSAAGLSRYPNLLSMATDFYDRHGTTGWLWLDEPPWAGAESALTLNAFMADPNAVPSADKVEGLTIRTIGSQDAAAYVSVRDATPEASGLVQSEVDPWGKVYEQLADWPHRFLFLAESDGLPAGAASLHTHSHTGWLRGATVAPEFRGRGIQRALIAARAQKALELGCDLVGSTAEPDGPSAANLARMGFRPIGVREQYEYQPGHR